MTSTHVAVTWPWVQPVVRPTLFTTFPTIDGPSLTMRNWPEIVRDPVFTPVVFAMNPWSAVTVPSRWLYAVSLYRHRWPTRPIGHFIASHGGSAISWPIRFPFATVGWKCCVPVFWPCTSVQWEFTTKPLTPARAPLKPRVHRNTLKAIWKTGEAVVNGWLSIPTGFSAEVMAHQGFDSLTVDMQHGVVDYQVAVTMLQAISTTPVIPLARVPWNDPARLMKILDAGVYGVICPMINTRAQAEALVAACKYAPRGYRSWGPVRASIYAGSDYGDHANDDLIVMPMIETAEAVKNIDEILSVPGVDAVYVGPSDLSLTLGCKPRLDQTDPPVVEAQQRIVDACKRHGVVAGIHNATAAYALKMIAAGYQFVTLASDSRFLAAKAAEEVAAVRKTGVKAGKLPAY